MKVIIRNAAESDLDALAMLERECFENPWEIQDIREELIRPLAHALVAVQEDSLQFPSGALFFRMAADEMEILKIVVRQANRRRGLASLLLSHGISLAGEKGAVSCFLEVRPSNHAAVRFYERKRFYEIGRRRGYYATDGEDALVLKKDIHPNE